MPQIVQINVSRTLAPAPSTLQRTGFMVSVGGTTLANNATSLLTQLSDLTPILAAPKALTSLAWASSLVTATASAAHGVTVGQTFPVVISGAVPAGYNGAYTATATTTTAFTYPLTTNPGTETTAGAYLSGSAIELTAMATSYFAQGNNTPCYVLELGASTTVANVASLSAYVTANPGAAYAYLVPRAFASDTTYLAFVKTQEANTAKVYFYTTVPTFTVGQTFTGVKSVVQMIEAPTIPVTEFSNAANFFQVLTNNPSNTNKVAPQAFRYMVGMTAYPITNALATQYKAANLNWVGTGAEGGIANTILFYGVTGDGRGVSYWYAVDWAQINLELDLANEVINGSNDPTNPLYYDQNGINRLQARAQSTLSRGLKYGMINTSQPPVVDAIDFITYTTDNPDDYPIGLYQGLSASIVPAQGFEAIIFNLNVTDFITS